MNEPQLRTSEEPARDEKGRIRPGHTLNPGGVPEKVREARRLLATELLPEAMGALKELLQQREDIDARQFAIKEVLAYSLPKPKQTLRVEGGDSEEVGELPRGEINEILAEHVASNAEVFDLAAAKRRAAQAAPEAK